MTKEQALRLANLMMGIWVDEMGSDSNEHLAEWIMEIWPFVVEGTEPPDHLKPWDKQAAYQRLTI